MKPTEFTNPEQILLPSTHFQKDITENESDRPRSLSNRKHIAQQLNQDIINNIQQEIVESKITISSSRRVHKNLLKTPILSAPAQEELTPQKLHEIVKRRRQLDQEMMRLKYQESRVKQHSRRSADKKERSQFTQEQHQQIAKAIQAQKQLQKQLELKNKRLEEELQKNREKEEAERRIKMDQACREKQKQIAEHLKQLQKQKKEREQNIKELNRNYKSVKGRIFLHEKMEESWKSQQKKYEEQDKHILSLRKKEKEFSMQNIIEHQKKYKTFAKAICKDKQAKFLEAKMQKDTIQKQTLYQYKPSSFLNTIFQQEKMMKQAEEERNNIIKNLVQSKNKYGEIIREMNRELIQKKITLPLVKGKNDLMEKKEAASKSMSRLQIAEIGNRYLREVHSSIDHIGKSKSSKMVPEKNRQPDQQKYKYQDYLQDMKRKRAEKSSISGEIREINELKQVLMRNSNAQDKLYHARKLAEKIEEKAKDNSSLLACSIHAKLAILSQFCS